MAADDAKGDKAAPTARPSFEDYPQWLETTFNVDLKLEKNRFERENDGMRRAAETSPLWARYQQEKTSLADSYVAQTTYRLFVDDARESVVAKPWSSFLHKTYRNNVMNNENWPEPPERGWLTPENWFVRVHDIARTTVVVKYLDGVTTVTQALARFAEELGVDDFVCEFEARDTGYYAAHIRAGFDFGLMSSEWKESRVRGWYEIQVTTQLQEVIRKLTHKEYEGRRAREIEHAMKWQWDYTSEAFKPNYLGHILHYLEGMIMEVRDRK